MSAPHGRDRSPVAGVALAIVIATVAGIPDRRPPRPNVLLITVDTLRADRLSAYGYRRHQTPNFDRLADEGALFEQAFCDVTWTTPSMASVMTGTYATEHGLRSSFQFLPPEATTIAELLRGAGYHTAAVIGSFPLHSVFGLDQGFRQYDQTFTKPLLIDPTKAGAPAAAPPTEPTSRTDPQKMRFFLLDLALSQAYRTDTETSDRVLRWLHNARERREPFFLWAHYFGPHEKPTGLTDYLEERRIQLAAYDPDVVIADTEVGRVLSALDELGLAENTLVILHADHGQSLMEHDYFGHGRHLYDPSQRIPLLIRFPGQIAAGTRSERLARNLDIFPTVLEAAGIVPPPSDGTSLLAAAADDSRQRSDGAETYVETYLSANRLFADIIDPVKDQRVGFRRLGWRTSTWKLVINDPIPLIDHPEEYFDPSLQARYYSEELYDLTADPAELTNVVLAHRDVADGYRKKIWDRQRSATPTTPTMALTPEIRERLEHLGYLAQ